jgi:exosortase/archaeosortase family protein
VPMDSARVPSPPYRFALRLLAWSTALFALLRLPWVGTHILLPLTRMQADGGAALLGPSALPLEVTLACSGADALALCLGAILAYPVGWRMRTTGMAGGVILTLTLNIIRIGTLGRAAASPRWFEALHVYIWPAALTLGITAFVFMWMRIADSRRPADLGSAVVTSYRHDWRVTRRFALLAVTFLLIFTFSSPLYLSSPSLLAVAGMVARGAAFLLGGLGVQAIATAGILATPRGSFLVTQECIATPLIPVYFAAVLAYSPLWWTRLLWATAALPLFLGLGIVRLLAVAVPTALDTPPAFFVHAFSQILMAATMVCVLALWRHGARPLTFGRAIGALVLATMFVRSLGAPYTDAISWLIPSARHLSDPQGALFFLPAFQAGLFVALWVVAFIPSGIARFLGGACLLAVSQVVILAGLQLVAQHTGAAPLVRDIRAWALLGPVLVLAAVVNRAPPRH